MRPRKEDSEEFAARVSFATETAHGSLLLQIIVGRPQFNTVVILTLLCLLKPQHVLDSFLSAVRSQEREVQTISRPLTTLLARPPMELSASGLTKAATGSHQQLQKLFEIVAFIINTR